MADEIPITPLSDLAPPTPPPAASEPEAPALTKPESKEDATPPPPSLLEVTESEKEEALAVPPVAAAAAVVESEPVKEEAEKKQIPRSLISFKEESNVVADLSDSERKALQELKQLVQEALNTHQFTSPKTKPQPAQVSESESEPKPTHEPKMEEQPLNEAEELAKETTVPAVEAAEEVSIWGGPFSQGREERCHSSQVPEGEGLEGEGCLCHAPQHHSMAERVRDRRSCGGGSR